MFAIPIGRIYSNVSALSPTVLGAVITYSFYFWKTLLDTLLTREMLKGETGHAGEGTRSIVVGCLAIVSSLLPIPTACTVRFGVLATY